ncbi:hypothetical protein C7B61_20525 [filamentous cyanobacterium CCP1]|nr:hypothetical protein C7B76_29320 [filamentous cyanobacterium CCP2]PSB56497.1 hypothetical protein C7B61_20525 [filamentous cyanobacterium CCP1]
MGKKRITQLLEQLETNQQAELHNAAAIFTVAQAAVNELRDRADYSSASSAAPSLPALPSDPALLDKAKLLDRYGSYNGCRKAAKQQGIRFAKNPTWEQMVAAFNHREIFQQMVNTYLKAHPAPTLQNVTFEITV